VGIVGITKDMTDQKLLKDAVESEKDRTAKKGIPEGQTGRHSSILGQFRKK